MLGEYIFVCLVLVVLALLEFALIIILNRKNGTKNKCERKESSSLTEQNISVSAKLGVAKIAFLEDYTKETSLNNVDQDNVHITEKGFGCIPPVSPIHVIDLAACFIFPLVFVMYNCLYWSRDFD